MHCSVVGLQHASGTASRAASEAACRHAPDLPVNHRRAVCAAEHYSLLSLRVLPCRSWRPSMRCTAQAPGALRRRRC